MGYTAEQRRIQSLIVKIGTKRKATRKEIVSALETGKVESDFRNLAGGDGSSVGWRQETASSYPSVNRRDVKGAINRYFNETAQAGRGRGKTAGQLAQAVQRSAFPARYDQTRSEALGIYRSLAKGKASSAPSGHGGKIPSVAAKKKAKKPAVAPATVGGDDPASIAQQAADAAELRYGAEEGGIASLLKTARASLLTNANLETSSAKGLQAATKAAGQTIAKGYWNTAAGSGPTLEDVRATLAKIGPAADPYRAATEREHAGYVDRISEANANAQAEIARRTAQAEEGRAYGLKKAQSTYDSNVGQLSDRLQAISKEKGTYIAATFGTELGKAKDRKVKTTIADQNVAQRAADRKARLRQTELQQQGMDARDAKKQAQQERLEQMKEDGRNARAGSSGSGGKGLSASEKRQRRQTADSVTTTVQNARAQINRLVGTKKLSSSQVRAALASGSQKYGIPRFDVWAINAAYDLQLRGGLSPANAAVLKRKTYGRVPSAWLKGYKPYVNPARKTAAARTGGN